MLCAVEKALLILFANNYLNNAFVRAGPNNYY